MTIEAVDIKKIKGHFFGITRALGGLLVWKPYRRKSYCEKLLDVIKPLEQNYVKIFSIRKPFRFVPLNPFMINI